MDGASAIAGHWPAQVPEVRNCTAVSRQDGTRGVRREKLRPADTRENGKMSVSHRKQARQEVRGCS